MVNIFYMLCLKNDLKETEREINFWFGSKSLIKSTKNQIEVVRRKRNATLKYLKKDMADLLANGLDINAYGRVLILSFLL